MRSAGLLALTVGGAALAFLSLLLVVPFLVASTGVGGFIVGFVVSLVPLSVVLLAVHAIDRWEPEPKRLLFFAFTENILYFGRSIAESTSPATGLAQVFLLRGVM
jgi:hypothetical protein